MWRWVFAASGAIFGFFAGLIPGAILAQLVVPKTRGDGAKSMMDQAAFTLAIMFVCAVAAGVLVLWVVRPDPRPPDPQRADYRDPPKPGRPRQDRSTHQ
jgi:hypothetical protein